MHYNIRNLAEVIGDVHNEAAIFPTTLAHAHSRLYSTTDAQCMACFYASAMAFLRLSIRPSVVRSSKHDVLKTNEQVLMQIGTISIIIIIIIIIIK